MKPDMQRPGLCEPGASKSIAGGWQATDSVTPDRDREPYTDPRQMSLEDALRARDDGMRTAIYATDVQWTAAFDAAIARWAARGEPFTSDEPIAEVGPPIGSPNAVGARMNAAARAGVIRKVGYRPSSRPSRQGGVVAVWVGAA